MRFIVLLAVLMLAVFACGGCQSGTPPLVQVYATKQAYQGSLDGLTTLVTSGQISDRNTLLKIRDARTVIETGLAEAERAARSGDTATFKVWIDRVNAALEAYLKLQGPATRPVSLAPETPWTPQRSRPSFWPPAEPLPHWLAPSRPFTTAATSRPNSRPSSTESLPRLSPETTPR